MSVHPSLELIAAADYQAEPRGRFLLGNDVDVLQADLTGISVVELHFPALTDGRAFSQARLLRRRRRFAGTIRATGDVLIDQLLPMQRCGFDQAVLRADQDAAHGARLLGLFAQGYYQGDVQQPDPRFADPATIAATARDTPVAARIEPARAGVML